MMDRSETLPQISFIINLQSTQEGLKNLTGVRHLSQVFESQGLPLSCGINEDQVNTLDTFGIQNHRFELALAVASNEQETSKQFQARLQTSIAKLQNVSSSDISLIVGNADQLRNRAALLAREGIASILSTTPSTSLAPRPLPCGIWHLQPTMRFPQPRSIWKLFSRNTLDRHALSSVMNSVVLIEAAELSSLSSRKLQAFEKLLSDVSQAASRNLLSIVSIGTLTSQLAEQRKIKPQKSILRRAA